MIELEQKGRGQTISKIHIFFSIKFILKIGRGRNIHEG